MHRLWLTLAGLLGALGVAISAWSAHGLPQLLPAEQLVQALERARTANLQLMLHTLALLGVGIWSRQATSTWLNLAGGLLLLGILGFTGGIYAVHLLQLVSPSPWGNVVPSGGMCLILAWLSLAMAGLQDRRPSNLY